MPIEMRSFSEYASPKVIPRVEAKQAPRYKDDLYLDEANLDEFSEESEDDAKFESGEEEAWSLPKGVTPKVGDHWEFTDKVMPPEVVSPPFEYSKQSIVQPVLLRCPTSHRVFCTIQT